VPGIEVTPEQRVVAFLPEWQPITEPH